MSEHSLILEPQPMADQWMAKCSCGWRMTANFYDIPDKSELINHLTEKFKEHKQ